MTPYPNVFSPIVLNGLEIRNRIVRAVCAPKLFTAAELPSPSAAERRPPRPAPGEQADLL